MARRADPETRRRILGEAEHLIHLQGYHFTSMDEIARRCGMTKANLFHHFRSKEALGLSVLESKIEDYRRRRIAPLCSGKDPVAAVEDLFAQAARHYAGNGCRAGCLVANIALETADIDQAFRKRTGDFFAAWASDLERCLRCAQKKGVVRNDLSPKMAAEAIIALYEGAILLTRAHKDAAVLRRVGQIARALLKPLKSGTREGQ